MHSLNELMAQAPALDNTNGATQTHVLAGKTFWGLTSGQWGIITGTSPAAPVPKSDPQSDIDRGLTWPTPRFTDNGDGTVTDNLTGLIWLKNANCFGNFQTWQTALVNASSLCDGSCGLTDGSKSGDWRLPSLRELQSLVHYGLSGPAVSNTDGTGQWALNDPFTDVQSAGYWSSTVSASLPILEVWCINMDDGSVNTEDKDFIFFTWPVRGGP
jgi:hypothetical protein